MWEADRIDWSKLGAMGSATHVPHALLALAQATSAREADAAYWKIDNVVVVQGALYEAAAPTAACLVTTLPGATGVARARMLELLVQLGSGEPAAAVGAGRDIAYDCKRELSRGFGCYEYVLETTSDDDERASCVDLLGICASFDATLKERVRIYLLRVLASDPAQGIRGLIQNWVGELE